MLHSIAVHIQSVFCVPCTVCGVVQQCGDIAINCGNCSAVWDGAHFSARALRDLFQWKFYTLFYVKVCNSTQNDCSNAIKWQVQRLKYENWCVTNWTALHFPCNNAKYRKRIFAKNFAQFYGPSLTFLLDISSDSSSCDVFIPRQIALYIYIYLYIYVYIFKYMPFWRYFFLVQMLFL